jgi:hypothetical protein
MKLGSFSVVCLKLRADGNMPFLLVIAQQSGHKFHCNVPHVELLRWNSLTSSILQFDNVTNIMNRSPSVFQDSLLHFCDIFDRGSCRRSSRMLVIVHWHPSFFESLKTIRRFGLDLWHITKCFFKHFVCFCCRLTEFQTDLDANSLFFQISHFNKLVWSQKALTPC